MHLFLILSTNKHDHVRKKEKWKGLLFILTLSAPNPFFIADESVSSLFIVNQFWIYLLLISLGFLLFTSDTFKSPQPLPKICQAQLISPCRFQNSKRYQIFQGIRTCYLNRGGFKLLLVKTSVGTNSASIEVSRITETCFRGLD